MQRYPCPAQLLLVADGYLGCAAVGVYSGECNLSWPASALAPAPAAAAESGRWSGTGAGRTLIRSAQVSPNTSFCLSRVIHAQPPSTASHQASLLEPLDSPALCFVVPSPAPASTSSFGCQDIGHSPALQPSQAPHWAPSCVASFTETHGNYASPRIRQKERRVQGPAPRA